MTDYRKMTYPELASIFHGVLFAYEKTLLEMYGKDVSDIFPYLIEELETIIKSNGKEFIDPNLDLSENMKIIEEFMSNEEFYKDVEIVKEDDKTYTMQIGECTFAKTGVHDILKLKEGATCPMALTIAALVSKSLGPNEAVEIKQSIFTDKGTSTLFEIKEVSDKLKTSATARSEGGIQFDSEDDLFSVKGGAKPPLDTIDMQLVNILRNDGRLNNVELAETLKTSEATVRRRIQNLIDKGYIKGFSALLDYTKFTPKIRMYLSVNVEDHHRDELVKDLVKVSKICSLYRTLGDHNIMAEILFDDMISIQKFIDNLSKYEYIKNINYHIATSSYKPCPWYGV